MKENKEALNITTIEDVKTKVSGLSLLVGGLLHEIKTVGTPSGCALDDAMILIDEIFTQVTDSLDTYIESERFQV